MSARASRAMGIAGRVGATSWARCPPPPSLPHQGGGVDRGLGTISPNTLDGISPGGECLGRRRFPRSHSRASGNPRFRSAGPNRGSRLRGNDSEWVARPRRAVSSMYFPIGEPWGEYTGRHLPSVGNVHVCLISHGVIPAQAGTCVVGALGQTEVPACAGMTPSGWPGRIVQSGACTSPSGSLGENTLDGISPRWGVFTVGVVSHGVIPAQAGISVFGALSRTEVPACSGMTPNGWPTTHIGVGRTVAAWIPASAGMTWWTWQGQMRGIVTAPPPRGGGSVRVRLIPRRRCRR